MLLSLCVSQDSIIYNYVLFICCKCACRTFCGSLLCTSISTTDAFRIALCAGTQATYATYTKDCMQEDTVLVYWSVRSGLSV